MASELPEEIVMEILAALDVPDLVRAGSVCSAWHGAYTSLCSLGRWRQPQTPCLLYTARSRGDSAAGLYSLSEKKPYALAALPDPPIRSRHLIGSACGWIITADERSELHLLNPITGDQIALPPVATFGYVEPIYDKNGAVKEYSSWCPLPGRYGPWPYSHRELRDTFFQKVFLSSDPCTGDYIVVVMHNPYCHLSFARGGDDHWTLLPHESYEDCVFKDGLLYAVTRLGAIIVFDFSGPGVESKFVLGEMRGYAFERVYIAQTPSGDLLQIWSDVDYIQEDEDVSEGDVSEPDPLEEDEFWETDLPPGCEPRRHHCTPFKLFKVDLAANKLVEIRSLGENVLFIGQNQTVCLNAQEHPQLKANHIYFTDNDEYIIPCKNMIRDIGVLNLCDNSKEKIASPQIWSNWPSPIWITPNPRKLNSDTVGSIQGTSGAQPPPTSCWTIVFRHRWSIIAFVFLLFSLCVSWLM